MLIRRQRLHVAMKNRRARQLLVLLLVGWSGFAASGVAGATAQDPRIRVKPSTVTAGKVVIVEGWVPACHDEILLLSRAFKRGGQEHAGVAAVRADVREADGYYNKKITIPIRRRPGTYSISGRCGGGNVGAVTLRVLRP